MREYSIHVTIYTMNFHGCGIAPTEHIVFDRVYNIISATLTEAQNKGATKAREDFVIPEGPTHIWAR